MTDGYAGHVGAAAGQPDLSHYVDWYGEMVEYGTAQQVMLGGRHTLWSVTGNGVDLFAIDTVNRGPWHFIGRLEPGTVVLGSSREARHILAARPDEGSVLHRIYLPDLTHEP